MYSFCLDQKLEIERDWLKDEIDWKKKQNKDIKKEQKAESMLTD